MKMNRAGAAAILLTTVTGLVAGCGSSKNAAGPTTAASAGTAAPKPAEIRLDFAYYSPLSLAIKQKGWAEEAFKADGIPVKWVFSTGSNKALEFLAADAADFTSSAGSAALLAKANGNPIKSVYIYSKPEWTALLVGKDSQITDVKQLKGKKIAATKGTDPYIFLLRVLRDNGMTKNDVQIVHLQHPDGKTALEQKQVDAWAGLDPHMATTELEQGSRFLVRNADYNTYGFLNTREAFAKQHPDQVKKVIEVYEKARVWAQANPEELAKIVADEAKLSPAVAKKELERNDFSNPIPGDVHLKALTEASKVLVDEELIKKGTDINKVITELVDGSFAQAVVKK
jgi:sulfonate transport system substrate-binding protein